MNKKSFLLAIICITFNSSMASEYIVNSIASFNSAQTAASAGDVIIWKNNSYSDVAIVIYKNGLIIRAESSGGVFFNGANSISISGNNNLFSGFQFTSGSIKDVLIVVSGSHNLITQLNINGYSAQKYINLQGQFNEVSYCNFENKPATAPSGNLIHISPDATTPGYNKIRYCSFKNMPGNGGDNGNECIRISNGATSTYISRTVVEYCYFENTGMGDSEAISVKCRDNILRYNTCVNNQNAMFVFRNGDNNVAYSNFFINSGGIRVKEANNIYCYNNYFEKAGVGGSMDAVTYIYYTANTPNVLKNINFLNNTFVECGDINFDNGATNNTWANNIFKKSSGNIFTGSISGISFTGNIYTGTLGLNIPSGMKNIDPKLETNINGYLSPSSSSAAIDASSINYPLIPDVDNVDDDPNLMLDISGLSRPSSVSLKDVGCSEYNGKGMILSRPLKLSNVGPIYLGGPTTGIKENSLSSYQKFIPLDYKLYECYPNPFNPETVISFSIPKASHVSLKIFDQLGKEIATLIDQNKDAGFFTQILNTKKYLLSSGIYFCRMQTDKFVSTKKLLLIK